jgi:Raf kinase inhibitor-like YbhB/YbcL family protein
MTFIDTSGRSTTDTYSPRRGAGPPGGNRGGASGDRPPRENPPRPRDNGPPPPRGQRRPRESEAKTETPSVSNLPRLKVTSAAIDTQGRLLKEYTCDGASVSPPVQWADVPEGTKSFALNLWHVPGPGEIKSYWVVYNIPGSATGIETNAQSTGVVGQNGKRRSEYDPMCSKGPGLKDYHVTVYALSKELTLAPTQANRESLLAAVKDCSLAEGTLNFQYERQK